MRRRLYMPLLKNNNHGLTNNGHLSRQIYRVNLLAYIILPPLQKTAEHWSQIRTRQTLPKNHFCADKAPPRHQAPHDNRPDNPRRNPTQQRAKPEISAFGEGYFWSGMAKMLFIVGQYLLKSIYIARIKSSADLKVDIAFASQLIF